MALLAPGSAITLIAIIAGMTEWFKIGRGVGEGCILSPCLFNAYLTCMQKQP